MIVNAATCVKQCFCVNTCVIKWILSKLRSCVIEIIVQGSIFSENISTIQRKIKKRNNAIEGWQKNYFARSGRKKN